MIRQCSRCYKPEYKNKEAVGSGNSKHARFDWSRFWFNWLRCVFVEFNWSLAAY